MKTKSTLVIWWPEARYIFNPLVRVNIPNVIWINKKNKSRKIDLYNLILPNLKTKKVKDKISLKNLIINSDIITLHTNYNNENLNLLNKNNLKFLKKNSIIINTSRPEIIDYNYLYKILKLKRMKGAALDVFNDEPNIHKDYYKLKNVILSPHNASGTNETRLKMAVICSQNIYHYLSNGKVYNKI